MKISLKYLQNIFLGPKIRIRLRIRYPAFFIKKWNVTLIIYKKLCFLTCIITSFISEYLFRYTLYSDILLMRLLVIHDFLTFSHTFAYTHKARASGLGISGIRKKKFWLYICITLRFTSINRQGLKNKLYVGASSNISA